MKTKIIEVVVVIFVAVNVALGIISMATEQNFLMKRRCDGGRRAASWGNKGGGGGTSVATWVGRRAVVVVVVVEIAAALNVALGSPQHGSRERRGRVG